MSELHDLLASEANRGPSVAGPPFETIVARSQRRRVAQLATVVGVVLVVTAAVVVPSVVSHHRTATVAVGPGGGGGAVGATTEADRIAITQQAAEQLAAGVQLPTGAVALPTAPTQAFAVAPNSPGSQNLIDVGRFYTVPGTIESVLAYVKAYPPAGTFAQATSTSSGDDGVEMQGIMFSRVATADYDAPVVWVEAMKLGAGVAVRVDAELVWRTLRTAVENLPADISKATACYGDLDCPGTVLGAQDARELAAFFNSLDTLVPGDSYGGCSVPVGSGATAITFDVSNVSVSFMAMCGQVIVTANGIGQPTLDLTDVAMDPQLKGLLGLNNAPSGSSPAPVGSGFASAPASAAASSGPS
jgi:hypothetical protein